jgi:hypothetical protein
MAQPETFTAEPAAQRSGGRSRFLIGVLIGCGGLMVLCCGGFAFLAFMAQRWASEIVEEDPAEIRAATQQIATIDIPASFEPTLMLKIAVPILGDLGTMAFYQDQDAGETGIMLLAEFSEKMLTQGKSPEQLAREIGSQAQLSAGLDESELQETSREDIARTIRGQPTTFSLITGTREATDRQYILVRGVFPGRVGGMGFFSMTVDAEGLSIDQVKEVVNSIE